MQDKRGISAIIATMMIILLVIVAVGIIWVVIRNIISEGVEEIELGKFTFDLSIKSAYIEGNSVNVGVRRSPGGGDLTGVRFIFLNSTQSISVDRKTPLLELQEKLFIFGSSDVGNVNSLQEVSIAPIYKLESGKEKIGSITDTATISGSSGNGGEPGTGYCGDGIIQNPNGDGELEVCDGMNLGGENCISQGFVGGTLVCNVDCLSFDVSSCTSPTPASCDGSWNPPENPEVECDGGANCNPDCTCPIGFTADGAGGCDLNSEVNTGTIFSVWNNVFFDSQDLPKDSSISGYINYYVNFSNSAESNCFRINFAAYLADNDISYLRLDDSVATPNINSGETHHIWEAANCGT